MKVKKNTALAIVSWRVSDLAEKTRIQQKEERVNFYKNMKKNEWERKKYSTNKSLIDLKVVPGPVSLDMIFAEWKQYWL